MDLILLLNPILYQPCVYYPIDLSFHFYQEKRKIYYYITSVMHVLCLKCIRVIPLNHLVCVTGHGAHFRSWSVPLQGLRSRTASGHMARVPVLSTDQLLGLWHTHNNGMKTDTLLSMIAEISFRSLEPLRLQASHAHPITSKETPISYQKIPGKTTQLRPQLFKI